MEYLLILILLFIVSILIEFKFKFKLYTSLKQRILIPLFFFVVGFIWDSFGVYRGHWSFGTKGLLGINIWLLPIEESLFFLVVPYFIITFYLFLSAKYH